MRYSAIVEGCFVARPNRFIAHVELDGGLVVAHVKNTGRCRELLVPGATVYLEHAPHPRRKTAYSLVAARKGGRLINMDSQAPNKVAAEALLAGWVPDGLPGPAENLRREVVCGSSRLDLQFTSGGSPVWMEVKGVTLEEDGDVFFPDAPTERGIKHLDELAVIASQGELACVLFVVQMADVGVFRPNDRTHASFGDALRRAVRAGVLALACDCDVTQDCIILGQNVPIKL